jgi:hypothetical protein
MPDASEEVKQMAKMGEKKLRDFAKTKHKGLPEKVKEEMECGSDDKKKKNGEEEDPRSMKTKVNLVKNKLRAMGLKMSYEPEGDLVDEARRSEKEGKGSPESPLSYPGRKKQLELGVMGGRHWQSGGEGGSRTERGRKKSDKQSQAQRLRGLSNYPEKPGKYAEMQRKRRGGDIGSRFD